MAVKSTLAFALLASAMPLVSPCALDAPRPAPDAAAPALAIDSRPARMPAAAPNVQPLSAIPTPAAAAAAPTPATAGAQAPSVPPAMSAQSPTSTSPPASVQTKVGKAPVAPPEPIRLSDDPRPTLSPATFVATMQAAERFRAIVDAGGWPLVPGEVTRAKPGDRGPAITSLRRRLAVAGDLRAQDQASGEFDEGLGLAIKRFQARHGLEETGIVGPRTLVHLNISAEQRMRQLQASAARLMGSRFPFGDRYIAVNIPSAAVEAVDHGTVAHRYVAVVGKRDRPSPLVETRVTAINFNPTWTVPVSLIKKDIIPHVRKDPAYLAKMRIRLFDSNGVEIDPNTIDWSTDRAANYTVRQDSGIANSLGEVRIDMPNRHSVYMHDTPSKGLFSRSMRAQSSGCVRVSGVKGLAAWLLEGAPGPSGVGSSWGKAEIDAAIAGGTRIDARPFRPVPVVWTYLTGYATPDGTAHFRDDVYGLDEASSPAPVPAASGAEAAKPLTIDALVTSSIGPPR